MENDLRIALIQSPLVWHNSMANRDYFERKIRENAGSDLFILPEMFTSGFTMDPEDVAEEMNGDTVIWLKNLAKDSCCAITGSIVVKEDNKYYNRLLFVDEFGTVNTYDKRHLFTLAGEQKSYTAGTAKLIVEYKGWRICPLICYDLRFPAFLRNQENYDLLIFVANWPEVRIQAWDILLKARAVENMAYVAGVNRIGTDNNGHRYSGSSQIINEFGNYITAPTSDEEVITATLSKSNLKKSREKFGFLNDMDHFTVV